MIYKHASVITSLTSQSNKNKKTKCSYYSDPLGGVVFSILASIVADRGFEPRSGQAKDYKIGICCFSTKQTAIKNKSKFWQA